MSIDFLAGLGKLPDPMGDIQRGVMSRIGMQQAELQTQAMQAKLTQDQEEAQRVRMFETDVDLALRNATPASISNLIIKHPKYADSVKKGWDLKEGAARQTDLTQLGEMYSAGLAGKYDIAAKLARRRLEADVEAGLADESDHMVVAELESNDPVRQKAALGMIGTQVAIATGPEHFNAVYGTLNKGTQMDIRANEAGASIVGIDPQTGAARVLYESPYIKTPKGGILRRNGGEPAPDGASGVITTAGLAAPQAAVASTLSGAGFSPSVVAGLLGNFEVEGGYTGGKGDGGSANGIAQWRGSRQTNFERIIGKPISQASHAEQAKFVVWEMENPLEAGMTVAQRDQILAAKTAPEAAALADKFYERSDGKHRSRRLAAANRYAGMLRATGGAPGSVPPPMPSGGGGAPPGFSVVIPDEQPTAPSGFRYTADGGMEAIPGGPADPSTKKPTTATRMSPAEVRAEGLDPRVVYYRNENGIPTAVSGQEKPKAAALPKVPATTMSGYIENNASIRKIDEALKAINDNPRALGAWNMITPDKLAQWADPEGVDARAGVSDVGSLLIHDRSGAAVTISETPRLLPFIPQKSDDAATAKKKLIRLRRALASSNMDMEDAYSNEEGDSLLKRIGRRRGAVGGGIKVRSLQEARKLPKGTVFITPPSKDFPNGQRKIR